jgi:hypothetical protein
MSEELSEIPRTPLESDRRGDGEQIHGVGRQHDKYKLYSQMKEPKPHVGDVDTRDGGNYDQTKNDCLHMEADTDILKPLLSAARYHHLDDPQYSRHHTLASHETLE